MSVRPLPYRSARAGVEKPLSALNQGKPANVAPEAASRAYSSWPTEGATTSGPALEVADGQGGRHRRRGPGRVVAGRVLDGHVPAPGPVRVEGLVAALVGSGRVAGPDENGVVARAAAQGGHRGRRVHRGSPGARRPARHGPAGGQREGVHVTGPVPHHDGGHASQGGDIGRREGDRVAGVGQGDRPDLDEHQALGRRRAGGHKPVAARKTAVAASQAAPSARPVRYSSATLSPRRAGSPIPFWSRRGPGTPCGRAVTDEKLTRRRKDWEPRWLVGAGLPVHL